MKRTDTEQNLDAIFGALADPTRRQILRHLKDGSATVATIAELFPISQPAISKHLAVLEKAGLIDRTRDSRSRPASLRPDGMRPAAEWIERYRALWEQRFDQLEVLLADLQKSPSDSSPPTPTNEAPND